MKYFFLLFSLVTFIGYAQSNDCSKFKTGTFKFVGSDNQNTIITRNNSIQIEENNETGIKYTGSIKWISDCKYTLTYTEVSNPDYSSIIGTTFNVDITSTTKSTYKYSAYNDTRKITGEIIKVK
ncbi:hypothetical protein [uncultured Lacinutrix sp.]|uniref:hypothetical protein n=1 Tax=uncultured Lacinutrix sp. TaxID=574032 RepID=UPI0026362B20|nr:hypothetical protein [uncultured Lacinutrix sp.]